MHPSIFKTLFVLLPLAYQHPISDEDDDGSANAQWNYLKNGADWEGMCATGLWQTPIKLSIATSRLLPIRRIFFGNYDVMLKSPLTLLNNGHTAKIAIPETESGQKPFITGGILNGIYVAEGVHFHWGSPTSRGSEHVINNARYDMEMHILHRNERYKDLAEAVHHADGIAVLGIMLKVVRTPYTVYPGFRKIFDKLPKVVNYQDAALIDGYFSLGQLLGGLNTVNFYTYKGSLTTPGCNEAVTWTVFEHPLPIALSDVSRFWQLKDSRGNRIRDNYRNIQPRNKRPVYYRFFGRSHS